MVLRIRNIVNVQNNVIGIIFRRREQFETDIVFEVLSKVIRAMVVSGYLEVHLNHIRTPAVSVYGLKIRTGHI